MENIFVFATNNGHKISEIRPLLPAHLRLMTLRESGLEREIEEPFDTLEENAAEKCRVIAAETRFSCFAEDSGLFVEQLGGGPGVHSARYAEGPRSDEANIKKLLLHCDFSRPVQAYFKTVIALWWKKEMHFFQGICPGIIIAEPRGTQGFGYDPVFVPEGSGKTFAEMDAATKAIYSHRAKAVVTFTLFLNDHLSS